MRTSFSVLALVAAQVYAALPTTDLAGCQAFALTFDNTCTNQKSITNVNSWPTNQTGTVSCSGTMRCPGGIGSVVYKPSSPCSWSRKLCVTCVQDSRGIVKIRVQSNTLPNHCVNSTVNNALESLQDWEVVWQPNVSSINNYTALQFNSSAKTDEILCDIQRTGSTNMNEASGYDLITGPGFPGKRMLQGAADEIGTQAGLALSGGAIFNALASGNKDAVEDEIRTLDVCLSHPTPFSQFHYHFWSACAVKDYGYWSDTEATPLCAETDNCLTDPASITMTGTTGSNTPYYTAANWDKPLGIARDGHLIMGPYKDASGTRYDCTNRDVCNGAFVGDQYVYVGSETFPYVVGCWGPGPDPEYKPCCSTNGCGTTDCASASGAFELGVKAAISASIVAFALF